MQRVLRTLVLLVGTGVMSAAQAEALDIQLNDDAARIIFSMPSQFRGLGDSALEAGFGYNTDEDVIGHFGLTVHGSRRGSALQGGAGVRLYGGDLADETLLALAIGGFLRVGVADEGRFAIGVNAYYAPEITSFADTKELLDAQLRAEYQILPTVVLFGGLQIFEADFDAAKDVEFADGAFIGLRLGF